MLGFQACIIEQWHKCKSQVATVAYAKANVDACGNEMEIPLKLAMWSIIPLVFWVCNTSITTRSSS